ncbi:hypothetical protein GGU10DRAFT_378759 [Lentinula aff. detonsa]|uniref:Uncharacterized protein n=1 Tax=Lentinula aff. detonsa TaxID=2804958 RepID=A0AA38NJZ4_9AGAR|nr:hypothetical protein GGU10DRAFT_378759 [Lentinula aff. detonsa]
MKRDPVTFTWLPGFTSAHPHLRKIRFHDESNFYFRRNLTIPFIVHFDDQVRRERHLDDAFDLAWLVILSRHGSTTQLFEQWHVTGRFYYYAPKFPITPKGWPASFISTPPLRLWTKLLAKVIDQSRKKIPAVMAEAGMLWYTSRIARTISSVEAFSIYEEGYDNYNDWWTTSGWFIVQIAPRTGRTGVTGKLVDAVHLRLLGNAFLSKFIQTSVYLS